MSEARSGRRGRWLSRRSIAPVVSSVVTASLVVSAAFFTSGYKPVETEVPVSSVWLVNTDKQMAGRVNLQLDDLDAFASYDSEPTMVRVGAFTYALLPGVGLSVIDESDPQLREGELDDKTLVTLPSGITRVAGRFGSILLVGGGVAYRATAGDATTVSASLTKIDVAGVAAAAIADDGSTLVLGQADESEEFEVFRIATDGSFSSERVLADFDAVATTQLAAIGSGWIVLSTAVDGSGGRMWTSGSGDAIDFSHRGARLQRSAGTTAAGGAFITAFDGLWRVPLDDPASPVPLVTEDELGPAVTSTAIALDGDGCAVAAWGSAAAGSVARTCAGDDTAVPVTLESIADGELFSGDPTLVVIPAGDEMIVNDQKSGHAWRTSGEPLAATWDWTDPDERQAEQTQNQNPVPPDEQKPPVANDDSFGVRAGVMSTLPALLNDSDPNGDPFVIAPEGLGELSGPEGATRTVTNNYQEFALQVPAGTPVGTSYSFTYTITDGTDSGGGRYSNTATVTARVVSDETNTAPVFVGDDALYSYSIAAGESITISALKGWMDAEGDALFVKSATFATPSDIEKASVVATSGGEVVFKHSDPQDAGKAYAITVVVSDGRGGETAKALTITVSGNSALTAEDFARTTLLGQTISVDLAPFVHGARSTVGLTQVVDSVRGESTDATIVLNAQRPEFTFSASTAGIYALQYTVTSGGAEAIGVIIVRVVDPDAGSTISIPPQSVAVTLDAYAIVTVLDALQGAQGRVALVTGASSQRSNVDVDVVEFAKLRVSPNDNVSSQQAGTLIDVIDYRISVGGSSTTGQLSVFLKPSQTAIEMPIAVSDSVTVVSGGSVDIPVLDNDIEPSGGTLTLDPRVTSDSSDAQKDVGIYFPSRSVLRYQAPEVTSTQQYTIPYIVYGPAGQAARAVGSVFVTVVPAVAAASTLTVPDLVGRVAAGQSVTIAFTSFGVSSTNELVRITQIEAPTEGTATIGADGRSIIYQSASTPASTQVEFRYTVTTSTGSGASGSGMVRVAVASEINALGPTAVTDYLTVPIGSESFIDPIVNDEAPQVGTDQTLRLGTTDSGALIPIVEMNTSEAAALTGQSAGEGAALPDASVEAEIDEGTGIVTVRAKAGVTPGDGARYVLRYVVQDARGGQDIGRIVVTFASNPVPEYPVIVDSTISAKDYSGRTFSKNVVTGRATWASGDIGSLRVSAVSGAIDTVTISGATVSGQMPDTTQRVLLKFEGTANDGTEMATFAYLTITGVADISPELRDPNVVTEVTAGESVTFDMAQLLAIPSGFVLGAVSAVDPAASKGAVTINGSTVTFASDKDAGGLDFIRISVATSSSGGTTVHTAFALRVKVNPTYPELVGSGYTIDPDDTLAIDLTKLVTWYQHSDADVAGLGYTVSGDASAILATAAGSVANPRAWPVQVRADATVGATGQLTLSLSGQSNTPPVTLTFTVGSKLRSAPAAATCTAEVALDSGAAMTETYTLVGGGTNCGGERNSYPSEALTIVPGSVVAPTTSGVSVSGSTQTGVSLAFDPATVYEGSAVVRFLVQDAQGQVSDQQGTLTVTIRNLPRTPVIGTATSGDGVISFPIQPSVTTTPAIERYRVSWTGEGAVSPGSATVTANSGESGVFSGSFPNGARNKVTFTVCAVNALGESRDCATLAGIYAQRTPDVPTIKSYTATGPGTVRVIIARPASGDPVESYAVSATAGAPLVVAPSASGDTEIELSGPSNNAEFAVTVVARATSYGSNESVQSAPATKTVRGRDKPIITAPAGTLDISSSSTVTIPLTIDINEPIEQRTTKWGVAVGSAACVAETSGAIPSSVSVSVGAWGIQSGTICAQNAAGAAQTVSWSALRWLDAQSLRYSVQQSDHDSAWFVPVVANAPASAGGISLEYRWGSSTSSSGDWKSATVFSQNAPEYRQCVGGECTSWATIQAAADTTVPMQYALTATCNVAGYLEATVNPSSLAVTATVNAGVDVTYTVAGGKNAWTTSAGICELPPDPTDPEPPDPGATEPEP